MKRIAVFLAFVTLYHIAVIAQKKYEMVVEKTDGTEVVINVEDIVRTYFRERSSSEEPQEDDKLLEGPFPVGKWQECNAEGVLLNDATDYEVMHVNIYSNGTGDFWSVTKGIVNHDKYSFSYSISMSGNSGTITETVTASNYEPKVGQSITLPFTYENGIFHIGEICYKKINEGAGEENSDDGKAYTSCPDGNHPHMVDLDLPSGTKWACCNLGASTPESYGNYYAWGETQPKSGYGWNTYLYGSASNDVVSIGSDIAGTDYDAATANWGTPWRMPSLNQIWELLKNTTSTWTSQNDVKGRKFTGSNGGTIFLPAAGSRTSDELYGAGSRGNYWSSTLYESNIVTGGAQSLYSNWETVREDVNSRSSGLSVRPVR